MVGHLEKTAQMLERRMARPQTKTEFLAGLAALKLQKRASSDLEWAKPFPSPILIEKQLHDLADNRFEVSHVLDEISRGDALANGSITDSLLRDLETKLPRVLLEYKKPRRSGKRKAPMPLRVLAHVDQPLNYASQILFRYPEIPFLAIIVTDGTSFIAGYGKRTGLGSLEFFICKTPLSLYTATAKGADFKLFWTLCSYVSPQPVLLELQVLSQPAVSVKIGRCIGNGASSFVYEASLIPSAKAKSKKDPLYRHLEALENFVLKIPKYSHEHTWTIETETMDKLKQAGVEGCCVAPVHSGVAGRQLFTIYPLGVPVLPTISIKPATGSPLKNGHFVGLLKDLCAIHNAGLLHRDVRLENIVIIGQHAKLIDFGCSSAPTSEHGIIGTLATASQAILRAALQGNGKKAIQYTARDDLESLLKVFLMHYYNFKVTFVDGESRTQTLYDAWKLGIHACRIERLNYSGLKKYLTELFDRDSIKW